MDFKLFVDSHVYNKIPLFKTWESYNKTKQNFEMVFLGNSTKFSAAYAAFKELAKSATLFRFIHLPQTTDIYSNMVSENLGNDTLAFTVLPPLERYVEPAKSTWKSCKKKEEAGSDAANSADS